MTIAKTFFVALIMTLASPMALAGAPRQAGPQAGAQNAQARAQHLIDRFDTNGDRVLDARELEALVTQFHQRKAQRKAELLQRFDQDGDGVLGPAEKQALKNERRAHRLQKRFDALLQRFDGNGDGALSWAEVTQAANQQARAPGAGGKAGKPGRLQQHFRAADVNGDSIMTRAEFESAVRKRHEARRAGQPIPGAQ